MAHNIASINGQSAIAYIGSTPWHGLGTRLRGDVRYSIEASLAAAHLDWTVGLEPLYDNSGSLIPLGQLARRSSDGAQLAVVGPSYVAVQNAAAISILQTAIEELGATIEVIGALGRGERLWALVRLAGATVDVTGNGDSVQGYALLTWSHDGSGAVKVIATGTRAVCQNTIALARSEAHANVASIRHTASAGDRVEQARKLFTGLTKALIATGESFKQLAARELNQHEVIAYIESVFPGEIVGGKLVVNDTLAKRRATVSRLVFEGVGVEQATVLTGGAPNAWSVYNAVTEYFDHVRPAEASSVSGRQRANESALFGANAEVKVLALTQARQLVAA
jgi:phage/plasmid-like protein (TIGR03299 family)